MRTSKLRTWLGVTAGLALLTAGTALAHHGWTHYDEKKTLTISGPIVEASYANPHGTIRIRADGDGKTWLAVLAPPSRMKSRGLSQDMLKSGTAATVVGYPHRQHADELRAERITVEGKTIELR